MNPKDLSLLIIGDKDNIESIRKSILYFQKVYPGADVLLVNAQRVTELDDLVEELSINIYTPSKIYGYPIFYNTEVDKLIEWCFEVILKPTMLLKTKYFVFGEPDCFFLRPTEFDINYDVISNYNPNWAFGTLWPHFYKDKEKCNDLFNEFFDELADEYKNLNLDLHSKSDMCRVYFGAGTFINLDKFQDLYLNKKQSIIDIIKIYIKVVSKRFDYVLYMPDVIISLILVLNNFKCILNKNYEFGKYHDIIFEENDFNKVDTNVEIIHPIKIFYMNKEQSWGKQLEKKLGSELFNKHYTT